MVEQRPFKPKVVGSIPTAPTNKIASKTKGSERFRRNPFFVPKTDYSGNYSSYLPAFMATTFLLSASLYFVTASIAARRSSSPVTL